jgi:PsbP-like protein
MASGLRNVRASTIIIAAAVIILLFLPLTASTNNNALLQSQSVFAQVQEEEEITFLPYDNPIYGIFIQYPSDWTASTSGLEDYIDVIAFYSPLQNVSDSFPARLKISVPVYSQNISLQEYTNFVLTTLNQSEQIDVRNSSEVTVAGYPGYRVLLANQPFQNSTLIFYQMNTWTTIGNKVYLLTYEGEESTFNRHLPEVSQMLESLRIEQVI